MNIGLLVIVIVPLSVLVITPEIRRRRQNNVSNNNNNDEIIVNNDVDVDNTSYSYNIGKWIGNVISIVIIISILIVIRLLYSNVSSITLSLTKSKLLSTCPPVGINLIGAYGNIQGLNDIRNITSRKPETQILYKQGLLHLYGFNFEEANRNMLAAIDIEKDCIMCYCGLAYSYGPNINLGVYPDAALKGRLAIQKALNLIKSNNKISQKEKELVHAQYERFSGSIEEWETKGQQYYDEKYAIAMKELTRKFPLDNDIAAEYADSIMLLHPWNYYKNNYTVLHDDIIPAYETLKKILISNPHHPLALHLWIHISEQGPNPSQALSQADILMKAGEGIGLIIIIIVIIIIIIIIIIIRTLGSHAFTYIFQNWILW
jgi:tetratricopeptide (TPR) repeat protein